ncbi:MAG TPA: hypothetical protein VHH36_04695 [Candidatus Thermoplasmatota archaeon]|nr:hypothetical protein [Candidatus Thermoplasmatota archaeon]
MIAPSLLAASLLSLAGGALYLAVGASFARLARGPSQAAFSLFWFGVGFFGVSDGVFSLAVPLFDPPLAFGLTILVLKSVLGCVGFAGLLYALLYVYTGRRATLPLVVAYAVVLLLVLASYFAAEPVGQEAQAWRSGLVYARSDAPGGTIAAVLLFLPPLLGSLAYAALWRRASERGQRRRILAVSAAFAAFFGGLLVGWTGLAGAWWPLAEKLLAVGAALVVLAATRASPAPPSRRRATPGGNL